MALLGVDRKRSQLDETAARIRTALNGYIGQPDAEVVASRQDPKLKGRRVLSAATRAKMAASQRLRWKGKKAK